MVGLGTADGPDNEGAADTLSKTGEAPGTDNEPSLSSGNKGGMANDIGGCRIDTGDTATGMTTTSVDDTAMLGSLPADSDGGSPGTSGSTGSGSTITPPSIH